MIQPINIYRFLMASAWYTFAVAVVLLAIIFGMARILLPYASEYKSDVSETMTRFIGQPVTIGSLDTEWHGFGPALVLKDVEILKPKNNKSALQFGKARIGINLLSSLINQKAVISGVTLVGIDLVLTREKSGRFVVAGIQGEGNDRKESDDFDALTSWVFSQSELGLEHSNITWHDKAGSGRKMHFSDVNVRLRNAKDHHVLDASVELPERFGKSLTLHVDLRGNLMNPVGRKTRAYFRGEEVKFDSLINRQSIAGVGADVGVADFQIWSRWEDGALQNIEGEVDINDIKLFSSREGKQSNKAAFDLAKLGGTFEWTRKNFGWQFNGDNLLLMREDHNWDTTQIVIDLKDSPDGIESIDAYASNLQLEDATRLLVLFSVGGETVSTPLLAIHPQGEVKNARLYWRGDKTPTYKAYAELEKAAIKGWKLIPAVKNVDGQLWLNEKGGQVNLKSSAMTLNFPDLFRWPLNVNHLGGHIGWMINSDGWQLKGRDLIANNEDVDSRVSIDVIKDNPDGSPFISLVANFTDGDGSQVTHYLPTGIMKDTAVDWLDNAIVAGNVASGGTIIHGRLSDFPFEKGNGRFEVTFGVEEGRLIYAEGWPQIYDLDADVQFLGKSLSVNAKHGKIFSNNIKRTTVTLPDMKSLPMNVLVKGDVEGNTQNKLDYLVKSPQLNESFGRHLEGMVTEGDSLLHVDLNFPVGVDQKPTVEGWVDLSGNTLSVPALGKVLSDVNGRLKFYQDGLNASGLKAKLFGQSTSLKIETDKPVETITLKDTVKPLPSNSPKDSNVIEKPVPAIINTDRWIRIKADGLLKAKDMASFYFPPIKDLLIGDGEWDISFRIPVGDSIEKTRAATLQANTNLKGVEVKLPPPFTKQSDESAEMILQVEFRPGLDPLMRVNYAGFIDGLFELGRSTGGSATAGIKRGEVRLNGGDVSMPEEYGVRVVGWLDEVSMDDWVDILSISDTAAIDQKTNPSLLHSADIAIRKLKAFGQNLHKVKLKTKQAKSSWAFNLESEELAGSFDIPSNIAITPIVANLKYLYMQEPELTAGSINPQDIPSLEFKVDDLRYKSRKFGALKLETTRVANGLRIDQLILKPKDTTMISHGGWYTVSGKENSEIQININTTNVGQTLKELGYVGTISGGEGEVILQLSWPSALYDVNVDQVSGRMEMFLREGQLLDIDPGAGRLFGMLSLQSLPRRLLLDFSDVFSKGFGFSRIKGNFRIKEGNAYTNNLYLEGPSARVDIKGRTGLVDQDYDQRVEVTPKVTESLPVLGALAATPQVGAVILFFQKLFQSDIDEAAKIQYTITGSWSDPIITKVKQPKTAAESEDELPEE